MVENITNLIVGILFGASLDLAGFGSPKRLTAQFLLRDFSMFKVMFGAILAGSSLYSLFVYLGYSEVGKAIVPTLNWGLLIGGFLLGNGLVIGGYCPGTALVGAASGRIDAILFLVMMYPGYRIWLILETKLSFDSHSPLMQQNLTLPDMLGIPVVFVLALLALVCWLGWKVGNYFESINKNAKEDLL